jgi:dTDP-glucose 4,6-dehydratase
LETGLQKTVDWYLANREWLETIKKHKDFQGWLAENYRNRARPSSAP